MIAGLLAGADLRTKQFHIVKLQGGSGNEWKVVAAAADTDDLFGILINTPENGKAASVQTVGDTTEPIKIVAGAAIAPGDKLTSDADGKAIPTTTAGDKYIAFAINSAVAENDIVRGFLVSPGTEV